MAIVVPIVSVLALSARLLDGATVGQAIVTGLGTAFQVAVQMLFWFTLVFVLIERFGESRPRGAVGLSLGRHDAQPGRDR